MKQFFEQYSDLVERMKSFDEDSIDDLLNIKEMFQDLTALLSIEADHLTHKMAEKLIRLTQKGCLEQEEDYFTVHEYVVANNALSECMKEGQEVKYMVDGNNEAWVHEICGSE